MSFCANCGKEVDRGGTFCAACGQRVEDTGVEQVAPVLGERIPIKQRSKSSFLVLLSIALIVVLAAAVYFFVVNKSPKETLFAAEANTRKAMAARWQPFYGIWQELYLKMRENPYTSTMEIGADFILRGDYDNPDLREIRDIIKDSKLRLVYKNDKPNMKSLTDLGLVMRGAELINVQLYQSAERTGLKIPALSDYQFYVNNDEFGAASGKLSDKLGLRIFGPLDLLTPFIFYREIGGMDGPLGEAWERCLEHLTGGIEDHHVELTPNVNYNSPDGAVKLRQLTLNMNAQETEALFYGLLDMLQSDDQLIGWISGSIVDFYTQMLIPLDDRDYMISEIEDNLQTALDELRQLRFPDGFKMTVLLDRRNRIVDRDVTFSILGPYDDLLVFNYASNNWWHGHGGEEGGFLFEVFPQDSRDGRLRLGGNWVTEVDNNSAQMKLNTYFGLTDRGESMGLVELDMEMDRQKGRGSQEEVKTVFALNIGGNNYGLQSLRGTVNQVIDQNLRQNYHKSQADVELEVVYEDWYSGREVFDLFIDYTGDTRFKRKLDFPDLESANTVNLNTVSERELWRIMEDIEWEWESFLLRHAYLFGAF